MSHKVRVQVEILSALLAETYLDAVAAQTDASDAVMASLSQVGARNVRDAWMAYEKETAVVARLAEAQRQLAYLQTLLP